MIMRKLKGLVLACCIGLSSLSCVEVAFSSQENFDYTVAVIVWGNSETPLAQEITTRLRKLGFDVPELRCIMNLATAIILIELGSGIPHEARPNCN